MTDLEKFIELYKSVGIDLEVSEDHRGRFLLIQPDWQNDSKDLIQGYHTSLTQIHFDNDGKFKYQDCYEE